MNFDNYIFDFEGTLADTTSCHVYATKKAFQELDLQIPNEKDILSTMSQPLEESFNMLTSIDAEKDQIERYIKTYHQYYNQYEIHHIKEFAGITEMLQLLHNKKKKLFVVSDKTTEVLSRQLDYLGLNRFLQDAIGYQHQQSKPQYESLQTMIQNHHLNTGRTVYIGDTIHDVKRARVSNVKSCVVTWGLQSAHDLLHENPNYIVNEPDEIITIL